MCPKLTFINIDADKLSEIRIRAASAGIEIRDDAGACKIGTPLGEADVDYNYDAEDKTLTLQVTKLPAFVRCGRAQATLTKLVNG